MLRGFLNSTSWWLLGISGVATATLSDNVATNLVLSLVCSVMLTIDAVQTRNSSGLRLFLTMACWILALRILFRIIFTASDQSETWLQLPLVTLTTPLGRIALLGPVSANGIQAGIFDGLKLGAIVLCVGMAATVASPRRLISRAPAAFFELATAIAIAVNLTPQLVSSFSRLDRAVRLRGDKKVSRWGLLPAVLEDAFSLSLNLAASMESRGMGRTTSGSAKTKRFTKLANLAGITMIGAGTVGLIGGFNQEWLAFASVITGIAFFAVAIRLQSLSSVRTRFYREPRSRLDLAFRGLALALPILIGLWQLR